MKTNEEILNQHKEDEYDTLVSNQWTLEAMRLAQVEITRDIFNKQHVVSLEVAKLAKEKGFNLITHSVYDLSTDSPHLVIPLGTLIDFNWNQESEDSDYLFSAPTQIEIQKWLREKHNLHISIDFFYGGGTGFSEVYGAEVYNLSGTLAHGRFVYDTYEEALEESLLKALELIKEIES